MLVRLKRVITNGAEFNADVDERFIKNITEKDIREFEGKMITDKEIEDGDYFIYIDKEQDDTFTKIVKIKNNKGEYLIYLYPTFEKDIPITGLKLPFGLED